MSEKDIQELLQMNDVQIFEFNLYQIVGNKYFEDINLWDKRLLQHYLNITDMTMEQLIKEIEQ